MVNYRLTETMESRIHRKVYVRFGGEYPETRHRNMKMGVGYLAYIKIILFRVTNVQQKCTKNRFLTVKEIKEIKSKKYLCINVITCVFFDLLRLCFTP